MRIYTDHNGVAVNAISKLADGTDVEGHQYQVLAGPMMLTVNFQRGGVATNGVNGVTNKALLAILIHRTEFLDSKFICDENKWAIGWMKKALMSLEARTARRITRGVEGKEAA